MNRKDFKEKEKIQRLLWCDRRCCLCGKACGVNIEFAHIDRPDDNDIDNAIPVCFNCHSEMSRYNKEHPMGNRYRVKELKQRREQIYDKYTSHLVPPIHFEITQNLPDGRKRKLPDVGFNIVHYGNSLPVKVLATIQIFLGSRKLGVPEGKLYSGSHPWHMNSRSGTTGHFSVPRRAVESDKKLRVRVDVTIIDRYERKHPLLPVEWVYIREKNSWYFEPSINK